MHVCRRLGATAGADRRAGQDGLPATDGEASEMLIGRDERAAADADRVRPPPGTRPAKLTRPEHAARTRSPGDTARSTPRCWPAAKRSGPTVKPARGHRRPAAASRARRPTSRTRQARRGAPQRSRSGARNACSQRYGASRETRPNARVMSQTRARLFTGGGGGPSDGARPVGGRRAWVSSGGDDRSTPPPVRAPLRASSHPVARSPSHTATRSDAAARPTSGGDGPSHAATRSDAAARLLIRGDGRATAPAGRYTSVTISSNGWRSALATHSSGDRDSGSRRGLAG